MIETPHVVFFAASALPHSRLISSDKCLPSVLRLILLFWFDVLGFLWFSFSVLSCVLTCFFHCFVTPRTSWTRPIASTFLITAGLLCNLSESLVLFRSSLTFLRFLALLLL